MSDDEIKQLYIAFRADPANIQFNDICFCSTNSITIDRLRSIVERDPEVYRKINSPEVTDTELSTFLGLLTRLCYKKAFVDNIQVKSLEGLVTAITSLMKQRQLASGKPTEIVKYEELEKKTPDQLHEYIMGRLRRPFAEN